MKKILLLILFTLFIFDGYSQKKRIVYLNENYSEIELEEFQRKAKLDFFLVTTITNDTVSFRKLRFKEFFGKLEIQKKIQLNKLFSKRFNIDSTKTWLIHYVDSLPDVKLMPEKSGYIIVDSLGNDVSKVLSQEEFHNAMIEHNSNSFKVKYLKHRHVTTYKDYKNIIPSELKEIKRFLKNKNVAFIHFYGFNKGYPIGDLKYKWYRDYNSILKNTFTDGIRMYKTILVYPDGSFYLGLSSNSIRMLSKKNYMKSRKRWFKQYDKNSS